MNLIKSDEKLSVKIAAAVRNSYDTPTSISESLCEAVDGKLATISSSEENDEIKKLLQNDDAAGAWFGLKFYDTYRGWIWRNLNWRIDLSFLNWAQNEPVATKGDYTNFFTLQDECERLGGSLASIRSADESNAIKGVLNQASFLKHDNLFGGPDVWLAGSDNGTEGIWYWDTYGQKQNISSGFTDWKIGEPNNAGKWGAVSCGGGRQEEKEVVRVEDKEKEEKEEAGEENRRKRKIFKSKGRTKRRRIVRRRKSKR
ncbi:C-type lectin [Plakobranchus ocellatus]|uniref:C-type lectin n=1 Tax=Plakobranchus ocellatus TaxID=259542 RepID=A0AAV4BGB4_9GAST|nr:C-type lectin [Plakobranchus ocellatus]